MFKKGFLKYKGINREWKIFPLRGKDETTDKAFLIFNMNKRFWGLISKNLSIGLILFDEISEYRSNFLRKLLEGIP